MSATRNYSLARSRQLVLRILPTDFAGTDFADCRSRQSAKSVPALFARLLQRTFWFTPFFARVLPRTFTITFLEGIAKIRASLFSLERYNGLLRSPRLR